MLAARQIFGLGGLIGAVVMILVGILVSYHVYTELSKELGNMSGLWGIAVLLLGIAIPVVFILAVVRFFG